MNAVRGLLVSTALLQMLLPLELAAAPWWEDYTSKITYLCRDRSRVTLERNDAQAALTSGGQRLTLFREQSERPGLIYANDDFRVILRDDELTVEQLPRQVQCLRMEQV